MLTDRDSLLLEIYGRSGNRAKQAVVAWRIFRRSHSAAALSRLLDVIGQDKRDSILAGETGTILEATLFSQTDAVFLVEIERLEAAEAYVLGIPTSSTEITMAACSHWSKPWRKADAISVLQSSTGRCSTPSCAAGRPKPTPTGFGISVSWICSRVRFPIGARWNRTMPTCRS